MRVADCTAVSALITTRLKPNSLSHSGKNGLKKPACAKYAAENADKESACLPVPGTFGSAVEPDTAP